MMSGFAPVLADTFEISNTVVSPLVVQFGDFVEEMTAIAELKSNFPRTRVVDFSAYEMIMSFKGSIIYVRHSSNEGVNYYGKTVSWDVLAHMIRISKSNNHYMLGCEFSKITELTQNTGKTVFSFNRKVDAIIGVLTIKLIMEENSMNDVMFNILSRFAQILERKVPILPLDIVHPVGVWYDNVDIINWLLAGFIIDLVMDIIMLVLTGSGYSPTFAVENLLDVYLFVQTREFFQEEVGLDLSKKYDLFVDTVVTEGLSGSLTWAKFVMSFLGSSTTSIDIWTAERNRKLTRIEQHSVHVMSISGIFVHVDLLQDSTTWILREKYDPTPNPAPPGNWR